MKWLFIFLLLVNIFYFGWELDWQTQIDINNASEPFVIPANVKKLMLLHELGSVPAARQPNVHTDIWANVPEETALSEDLHTENIIDETIIEQTVEVAHLASDVMIEEEFSTELVSNLPTISASEDPQQQALTEAKCYSFGPFPDNEQAGQLTDWFKQKEISVNQRSEAKQVNQLFWIYLAPEKSRENAVAAIKDLKSKGVKDYRLINKGDLRNAISLGLFSTQATVNKRLNELKNKGYQPIVVPYHHAKAIYWVDVKLLGDKKLLNDVFTHYPSRFNSVPMDCSEIALL